MYLGKYRIRENFIWNEFLERNNDSENAYLGLERNEFIILLIYQIIQILENFNNSSAKIINRIFLNENY